MLAPFDPEQHMSAVASWAAARGVELREDILPPTGFVSDDAAAGWLYLTDSGLGLVESFVTNPDAPAKARARAVVEVGEALIAQAKHLGLTRLVITTGHRAMGREAMRHGFAYCGPMHVLYLEV